MPEAGTPPTRLPLARVAPSTTRLLVVDVQNDFLADGGWFANHGHELGPLLRAQGVENLILTGVTTNVCVESTARDGYMLDYHIVLVSDCTASYSDEPHQATLANIRRAFGRVATAEEISSAWQAAGLLPKVPAAVT